MSLLFIYVVMVVICQLPFGLRASRTVLIDSPGAAIDYFLFVKRSLMDDSSAKNFKNMSLNHRKNLCLKMLVDPVSFFESPPRKGLIELSDFSIQIHETFVKYKVDKLFLPELRFIYEGSEFVDGIPAHICVIEENGTEWAVAIVTHEDTLLLFRKPANIELFEITGLLESIPTVSSQAELKYLKKTQLASQGRGSESAEFFSWNRNDSMTFGRLNSHVRFRVCALAFLTLMEFEKKSSQKSNEVHHSEEVKRNAKILMDPLTEEDKSTTISADLIPCSVNENAPSLFVTNDPCSSDSGFILKPVEKNVKSPGGQKYKLVLYLEKIAALIL